MIKVLELPIRLVLITFTSLGPKVNLPSMHDYYHYSTKNSNDFYGPYITFLLLPHYSLFSLRHLQIIDTCTWHCKLLIKLKNGLKPAGTNCLFWCNMIIQMGARLLRKPQRCQWKVQIRCHELSSTYPCSIFESPELVLQLFWICWKRAVVHFDREKSITLFFYPKNNLEIIINSIIVKYFYFNMPFKTIITITDLQ